MTSRAVEERNARAILAERYNELLNQFAGDKLTTIGNYTISKQIGEGSFGKIYRAYHVPTGSKVVLKCMVKGASHIAREVLHHRQLVHPNIVRLYEVIVTENNIWIAVEYCPGDDLYNRIIQHGPLPSETVRKVIAQTCGSLAYIHQRHCVHRDLKLENILLDDKDNAKLCDFGFTRQADKNALLQTQCGTLCYCSPEMVGGVKYSGEKTDIWSLGVVFFALLHGHLPFDDDDVSVLKVKIVNDEPDYDKSVPADALSLIKDMLSKDPQKRPSALEILRRPYLTEGNGSGGGGNSTSGGGGSNSHNATYNTEALVKLAVMPDPVPFTSKLERRLLEKLARAWIDVEELLYSVRNQKCDMLDAYWAFVVERERVRQATKAKRRSMGSIYKYSRTSRSPSNLALAAMNSTEAFRSSLPLDSTAGSAPPPSPGNNNNQIGVKRAPSHKSSWSGYKIASNPSVRSSSAGNGGGSGGGYLDPNYRDDSAYSPFQMATPKNLSTANVENQVPVVTQDNSISNERESLNHDTTPKSNNNGSKGMFSSFRQLIQLRKKKPTPVRRRSKSRTVVRFMGTSGGNNRNKNEKPPTEERKLSVSHVNDSKVNGLVASQANNDSATAKPSQKVVPTVDVVAESTMSAPVMPTSNGDSGAPAAMDKTQANGRAEIAVPKRERSIRIEEAVRQRENNDPGDHIGGAGTNGSAHKGSDEGDRRQSIDSAPRRSSSYTEIGRRNLHPRMSSRSTSSSHSSYRRRRRRLSIASSTSSASSSRRSRRRSDRSLMDSLSKYEDDLTNGHGGIGHASPGLPNDSRYYSSTIPINRSPLVKSSGGVGSSRDTVAVGKMGRSRFNEPVVFPGSSTWMNRTGRRRGAGGAKNMLRLKTGSSISGGGGHHARSRDRGSRRSSGASRRTSGEGEEVTIREESEGDYEDETEEVDEDEGVETDSMIEGDGQVHANGYDDYDDDDEGDEEQHRGRQR